MSELSINIEEQRTVTESLITGIQSPSAMQPRLDEVVSLYQNSFASAPWNEKTKCALGEANPTCPDGFSAREVGETCLSCSRDLIEVAYTNEELVSRFTDKDDDGSHNIWYVEEHSKSRAIVLAAFARITTVGGLNGSTFAKDEPMKQWLRANNPDPEQSVLWLSDVFADTTIRPKGNLAQFGNMLKRLATGTAVDKYMIRTLNPKIVRAAQRDLGSDVKIADPAFDEIPNRGRFLTITRPDIHRKRASEDERAPKSIKATVFFERPMTAEEISTQDTNQAAVDAYNASITARTQSY